MKIAIIGGHVTPALALIDEIKNHSIIFIGRKYIESDNQTLSFEYQEITKRGIKFIELDAGRFTRTVSIRSFSRLLKIPKGFYQAFRIISREKPEKLVSFGGYLALPAVFWAFFFGIPVFIHEQTSSPGLTNRLSGYFAKKVFVSFENARKFFPQQKTYFIGNPVRKSIAKVEKKPFTIDENLPTIFISGGSLGSHSVNMHIKNILEKLLKKYQVIHQTGAIKEFNDYKVLKEIRENLRKDLKNRYFIKEHFLDEEFGYVYSVSDLVVGRSGANTFFELLELKKPAVFIPLPWSAYKEQQKQAEIFKNAGCGEIFYQQEDSSILLELIDKVYKNLENYKKNFTKLNHLLKNNAAATLAKEIFRE